jgi:hypothetical protein
MLLMHQSSRRKPTARNAADYTQYWFWTYGHNTIPRMPNPRPSKTTSRFLSKADRNFFS